MLPNSRTRSYYGYDGGGNVRLLSSESGNVTDTLTYDAFGNLLDSTGVTPNVHRYVGGQFDPQLFLYYNRARYMNTATDRFWTPDRLVGSRYNPLTLHKYLYAAANPLFFHDPSGNSYTLAELNTDVSLLDYLSFELPTFARAGAQAAIVLTLIKPGFALREAAFNAIDDNFEFGLSLIEKANKLIEFAGAVSGPTDELIGFGFAAKTVRELIYKKAPIILARKDIPISTMVKVRELLVRTREWEFYSRDVEITDLSLVTFKAVKDYSEKAVQVADLLRFIMETAANRSVEE